MKGYSISFTLGKASSAHGGNIEHNNRDFFAKNVNSDKSSNNILYKCQDIEEAYHELFDAAVEEHNQKQSRPCRRINDYYEHIKNGKREEVFYEAVIQFGSVQDARCGSERGEVAKKMLDDYMKSFQMRNSNLHVFNAVLHLDEASPHLHIDFIPFYTKGRTNGLSKGVSLKAALIEQGFKANSKKHNHLVLWEQSERAAMEAIVNSYGYKREDMNATYKHLSVEEYKIIQEGKALLSSIKNKYLVPADEVTLENVRNLKQRIASADSEISKLKKEKASPHKSFFYSDPDKQSFVQSKMDEAKIPYVETETGFDAQECYVQQIREWEKLFKASSKSFREQLIEDIDRLLMQCNDVDVLYKKLEAEGYTLKLGKYISVKPPGAERFIRLKSLGEEYNERALQNSIQKNLKFEKELNVQIEQAITNNSPTYKTLSTIRFYTVTFKKGLLPCNKKRKQLPFSWSNDTELDKLLLLNKKINHGATIISLKEEFEQSEKKLHEKCLALDEAEDKVKRLSEGKEAFEVIYESKVSDIISPERAAAYHRQYPNITANNYHKTKELAAQAVEALEVVKNEIKALETELRELGAIITAAEQVRAGTYVQELVSIENIRRNGDLLPNGVFKL